MNLQTFRLPGERELYPGEPEVRLRQMGGPVTLESFRFIHDDKLSWHRDLPVVFTFELLDRSNARRINAGTNKLLIEGARGTLKMFERALHRMYAKRGWLSYLPDELADELAKQLADETKSDPDIKAMVSKVMRSVQFGVSTDEQFAFMPQSLRELGAIEEVETSFSRWLDYFEYIKVDRSYVEVLRLHRFIVSCARVHDAVFSTYILHSVRA